MFQSNSQKIVSVGLLALLSLGLSACTPDEGYSSQPVVDIEDPGETFELPFDEEAAEENGIKISEPEEIVESVSRQAPDIVISVVGSLFSFSPSDSPRSIMNELRPFMSEALHIQTAERFKSGEFSDIGDGSSQVADITKLDIISESNGIPYEIETTINIYKIEDGEYPEDPTSIEVWRFTLEPAGFTSSLVAGKMEQIR